jgi:hypothetical protein
LPAIRRRVPALLAISLGRSVARESIAGCPRCPSKRRLDQSERDTSSRGSRGCRKYPVRPSECGERSARRSASRTSATGTSRTSCSTPLTWTRTLAPNADGAHSLYEATAACRSRQAAILHAVEQNRCPSLVARNGSEQCSQTRGCRPTILLFRSRRSSIAMTRSRQRSHKTGSPGGRSSRNVQQRVQ